MNNIIKDPNNDKFKVIKKTNKTIQSKLLTIKPEQEMKELFEALGYTDNTEEQSYVFSDSELGIFRRG